MKKNTIDSDLTAGFNGFKDSAELNATWRVEIHRANGDIEKSVVSNVVVATGLNSLASRLVADTSSIYGFIAVGTLSSAASLGSVVGQFGEVDRKVAAISAASNEVAIWQATWAGNADGLTGVDLMSAAVVNHVSSGQGTALNVIIPVSATLAASDFLNLQCEVQCGSHNI